MAVLLLYLNAINLLIAAWGSSGDVKIVFLVMDVRIVFGLVAALFVMSGFWIANESRYWGYYLGVGLAFLPFGLKFLANGDPLGSASILTLMFQVALVALLIHPQSRDYQRIWFK